MKSAFVLIAIFTSILASPGGYTSQDVDELSKDENFKNILGYAMESLSTYEGYAGNHYELNKVVSVQTQVVAGINYKIRCSVTRVETGETLDLTMVVFYQPWTGEKSFKTISENEDSKIEKGSTRFETTGGWQKLSGSQGDVRSDPLLKESVDLIISKLSEDGNIWQLLEIVSVSKQIVSGVNYKIDAKFVNNLGETKEYETIVNIVPWKRSYKINSMTEVEGSD